MTTKQLAFLEMYPRNPNITACLRACGINNNRMFYGWMEHNPEFRARYENARQQSVDLLVQEVHHRALTGTRRKKFTPQGEPIIDPETGEHYIEVTYGDEIFRLLRRLDPENWGDAPQAATATVNMHAGTSVAGMLEAIQQEPDYLDYLRDKAVKEATGKIEVTEGAGE